MWFDWVTRLVAFVALLLVIVGLLVLAFPDFQKDTKVIQLDAERSIHVTDLAGTGLLTVGALLIWSTVLAWQHKRIEQ